MSTSVVSSPYRYTLYSIKGSQPGRAVLWMMRLLHLEPFVTTRWLDLGKLEHLSPWFTELNPYQTVPFLTVHEAADESKLVHHLSESGAILTFLALTHGRQDLLGLPDPILASRVSEALLHHDTLTRPITIQAVRGVRRAIILNGVPAGEAIKLALPSVPMVTETLAWLDHNLFGKQQFIAGGTFSIADMVVGCELSQYNILFPLIFPNGEVKMDRYTNISRYLHDLDDFGLAATLAEADDYAACLKA
jgi:glutathione S-transferase